MVDSALNMVHDEPAVTVAGWQDVVLVLVHERMTEPALRAAVRENRAIVARYPRGVGSLSCVSLGVELPRAELRGVMGECMAAVRDSLRCSAQVVSGDGFWAGAARSVLTALELVRPDRTPRRVFGRVQPATQWMAEQMGHDTAWADALERAVQGLTR